MDTDNIKTRKQNRVKEYNYSQNGYYFITICTVNKQKILCNIVGDDVGIVPYTVSQKNKSLKILVTKTIGKPIFQRSFYDHIIRDKKDYLRIWEYIENNPGKWAEDKYFI